MKIYQVGGSVRDELLGLTATDRDFVVAGSTVEEMIAAGFKPVGKDFPVFLHPKTHEEYALARTERKTGFGYGGFTFYTAPTITLEEDLQRRDFTINAIAKDGAGCIIDPFGGVNDLQLKIFRHVSDAFSEDPLRVMRLGRFLARFPNFSVAAETEQLVDVIVGNKEIEALTLERRLLEWQKGLSYKHAEKMPAFLYRHHALSAALGIDIKHNPLYLTALDNVLATLDQTIIEQVSVDIRLIILLFASDIRHPVCTTLLPLSSDTKRLIRLFSDTLADVVHFFDKTATELQALFRKADPIRRYEQFKSWLQLIHYYQQATNVVLDMKHVLAFLEEGAHRLRQLQLLINEHQSNTEIAAMRVSKETEICQQLLDEYRVQVSRETR